MDLNEKLAVDLLSEWESQHTNVYHPKYTGMPINFKSHNKRLEFLKSQDLVTIMRRAVIKGNRYIYLVIYNDKDADVLSRLPARRRRDYIALDITKYLGGIKNGKKRKSGKINEQSEKVS